MKRALVLILITSMLSTNVVYAAGEPEVFSDVSVYADESIQSENEESYDGCEMEDYSDYDSGDSGTGEDYGGEETSADSYAAETGSETGTADTDAADNSGADAGFSDADTFSGNEAVNTDTAGSVSEAGLSDADSGSGNETVNTDSADSERTDNAGKTDAAESSTLKTESAEAGTAKAGAADDTTAKTDAAKSRTDETSFTDSAESDGNESTEEEKTVGNAAGSSAEKSDASGAENIMQAAKQSGSTEGKSTRTRIAIMSDIHYVTDQLISELGRDNLYDAALTEDRLMEEIDAILTAALEGASKAEPDALLICGDLVSNGELLGAKALAAKLKAAKEKSGLVNTGFYVVNGNHDINNSYAADFTGENVTGTERVQPADFKEFFSGLGYGDDDHWAGGSHSIYVPTSDDPSGVTNHGGLSYAADIAEGITLIVLDTGIYRTDESGESMYNNAQKTAGYVSDDLLSWAAGQAKEAKAKGNLVLAMSHHGLLPHYDVELEDKAAWYMNSFRIPNWEKVADTLADAGVTAVLTGHTHANDIASHVSKNNNVLYDVETAALCAYPCLWRAFDIESTGEGDKKTYTISIDTTYINDDLKADTSSWSFTIGGKAKTFDEDYNGNLQDYAYEKSGVNEEMLENTAMYMVKNTLSDIVSHEGGLAGYLKEQLKVPDGISLGEYAAGAVRNLVNGFTGFTKEISAGFFSGSVNIENATQEGDANPTFNITANLNGKTEHGKATLDMSYVPTAIDELAARTQTKLLQGDWLKNPYASNPLLDDIRKLIKKALVPALSEPLKEGDPDSTAVKLFNDAWQSFAKGDEGLADEAQKAKWAEERELLGGEALAGKLTQGVWTEALKLNTSEYPNLAQLLSQRIANEDQKSILTVEKESPTDYILPAVTALLGLDNLATLSSVIRTASSLNTLGMGNPIPASAVKPVTDKIVDLHEVMTTDSNITHDNIWDFQMVRFDANGGSVGTTHALTVEDHKLVNLPTPDERENYTFDGWFTAETGGRQVTADDDMTGICTLYAHWTYTGKDEEEEKPAPDDKKEEKPEPVNPAASEEDKSVTPASPSVSEDVKPLRERSGRSEISTDGRKVRDLHQYFVSRKALHDRILSVEYSDIDHEEYCAAIIAALKNGETVFNMGEWLSLDADAVSAIEASEEDVTLEYVGPSIGFRLVIPHGEKISRFADEHGSVCIVCLAEYYGYERIGEKDLLRQPLA